MLVKTDSPLRKIINNLNPHQTYLLDGIRYANDMAAISFQRLHYELISFSALNNPTPNNDAFFPSVFLDAWSVIDNLSRLSSLLKHLIRKSTPPKGIKEYAEFKMQNSLREKMDQFITSSEDIILLRNYHQHLNAKLDFAISQKKSLWGSLGWFYFPDPATLTAKIWTLIPGSIRTNQQNVINPAGKNQYRIPIDMITLFANQKEINLSSTIQLVSEIITEIDLMLRPFCIGKDTLGADLTLCMDLVLK
jgi:hypothetical protein